MAHVIVGDSSGFESYTTVGSLGAWFALSSWVKVCFVKWICTEGKIRITHALQKEADQDEYDKKNKD